jgi:hypothetical protein
MCGSAERLNLFEHLLAGRMHYLPSGGAAAIATTLTSPAIE